MKHSVQCLAKGEVHGSENYGNFACLYSIAWPLILSHKLILGYAPTFA